MISIIDSEGYERFLGNIEPPAGLVRSWAVYGDTPSTPMYTDAEMKEHARVPFQDVAILPPVADQDGIGECNASATCSAMEYQRNRQGLEYVQLSAGHLYGKINGGSDRGSLLEDGLQEAMTGGVATTKEVGYLDWRKRSAEADRVAKRYRVLEAFLCPTFKHCYCATVAGFSMITGIMWYSNYNPDGDGWLPRGGGSAGGHAIFGHTPIWDGRRFGIEHTNSWRPSWGRNGRFIIPETAYGSAIGGWWAVRAVVDEGGVVPAPQ